LRCSGWQVIRLWEHSLKDVNSVGQRIKSGLNRRIHRARLA
jgi:very-short-patch-repair endonuclease